VSPRRDVPGYIPRPAYALTGEGSPTPYQPPPVQDAAGIAAMRTAGAHARDALAYVGELVAPGMTTDYLDAKLHEFIVARGVYPSPLNYAGFPKSVCASVNEVVCHGIPDSTELVAGDIVKLDVSCFTGGCHGDTCRTFIVGGRGATDDAGRALVDATKGALEAAIAICGPGVPVGAIGSAVESFLAPARLQTVHEFAGHGVGAVFHTEPLVFHHANTSRFTLVPGMTFTIEPMVVERSREILMWADRWTVATRDRGRAAQFEHTLLVTEHGVEVLTAYE
jgi:methionyl aminopeptidase